MLSLNRQLKFYSHEYYLLVVHFIEILNWLVKTHSNHYAVSIRIISYYMLIILFDFPIRFSFYA